MNRSNALVERCKKVESFPALYDQALVTLSGSVRERQADEVLARWSRSGGDPGDLVDREIIKTEADEIATNF